MNIIYWPKIHKIFLVRKHMKNDFQSISMYIPSEELGCYMVDLTNYRFKRKESCLDLTYLIHIFLVVHEEGCRCG